MTTYYPPCSSSNQSIVDGLKSIGVDNSFGNRKKIAEINGIQNYEGKANQNIALLNLLKQGKLIKFKGLIFPNIPQIGARMNQNNSNNNNYNNNMIENIKNSGQFGSKTDAMFIIGNILSQNGYEPGFIAGLLANIFNEGNFGLFESSKYVSNPKAKPKYLAIMDNNYDYANKYSGKCVTQVNLRDLKALCDKLKKDGWQKGKFGLGIIQWTGIRTGPLVDHYLAEVNGGDSINLNQVISAEGKYMMTELRNQYSYIYNNWKNNHGNDLSSENAAYDAAAQICLKYEIPFNKEKAAEKRGNTAKQILKIMLGN